MSRLSSVLIFFMAIVMVGTVAAQSQSQSGKTIPITIESLESRSAQNGVVRFITHSYSLANFFPKNFDGFRLLRLELWNFDRTELFSSLEIDDKLVVDESIWEYHNKENPLRSWSLADMDDFFIDFFDVKNERVEIQIVLFPSEIARNIKAHCVSAISGKTLGPLNCKQIEFQP